MITQPFEYSLPATLQEALGLLAHEGAKPLAGGMSLIPMMKFRMAAPEQLVDIGRLQELNYIRREGDHLHIGAGVTHEEVLRSPEIRGGCPLLSEVAGNIGDIQVRNRGTIGGSAAHADPAADYPAALFALEARFKLVSAKGERVVDVADFFVDLLTTALEPGELVQEVIVPVEAAGTGVSYQKCVHPASGYAIVGVAVRAGKLFTRVGVTGVGAKAYRAHAVEARFAESGNVRESAARAADGVDASSDIHASSNYRKHLAAVYCQRALTEAVSRRQ